MSAPGDITAILNAHAEGVLAGPSIVSFVAAIEAARDAGLTVEGLIVLDRADAPTRQQFAGLAGDYRIIETDLGDPGAARNAAVAGADSRFVAFLDGDDLWCRNWLVAAHRLCAPRPDDVVAHPEFDVIFGDMRALWWHVDSRAANFDLDLLRFSNYWDSMSFAARRIYLDHPFVRNDLASGFGHEDWHWNCVTLQAGLHHCPALGTMHFKRRRRGSQLTLCDAIDAIPWVTPLASYDYQLPPR